MCHRAGGGGPLSAFMHWVEVGPNGSTSTPGHMLYIVDDFMGLRNHFFAFAAAVDYLKDTLMEELISAMPAS